MRPEVVCRLLGGGPTNPAFATVVSLATLLSLDVTITRVMAVNDERVRRFRNSSAYYLIETVGSDNR